MVNHNHTPGPAEKLPAAINEAGGTAAAVAADVSSRSEYGAMIQRLLATFGRWDILVNNAAIAITKLFPEITEADLDLSYAVNVKGVFHGMQLAYAHMADNGRIITISSSTTSLMLPGYAVYDATKGAVEQAGPARGDRRSGRIPGRRRGRLGDRAEHQGQRGHCVSWSSAPFAAREGQCPTRARVLKGGRSKLRGRGDSRTALENRLDGRPRHRPTGDRSR
jgi:hypothetical protein